jgi:hypothetical protein
MTTITTPVSLNSLQTAFGGSTPTALSEYYEGTVAVPSTLSGAVAVASSGANSLRQYVNADDSLSPQATAQFIWENASRLIQGNIDRAPPTVGWPGYYFSQNGPYDRDASSITSRALFDNATFATPEKTCTLFVMALAQNANITSVKVNGSAPTASYGPAKFVQVDITSSAAMYQLNTPVSEVEVVELTWALSSSNNGSWPVIMLLPGTWDLQSAVGSIAIGDTLLPGDMHLIFAGGGDGALIIPSLGVPYMLRWTAWWYNSYGMQANLNCTNSTQTYTTAGAYTVLKLRKR